MRRHRKSWFVRGVIILAILGTLTLVGLTGLAVARHSSAADRNSATAAPPASSSAPANPNPGASAKPTAPAIPTEPLEGTGPVVCVNGVHILHTLRTEAAPTSKGGKANPLFAGMDFKPPYNPDELLVLSDHWMTAAMHSKCVKAVAKRARVSAAALPDWFRQRVTLKALVHPVKVQLAGKTVYLPAHELVWYVSGKPFVRYSDGALLYPVGSRAPPSGKATTLATVQVAPLGQVGPGQCVPGKFVLDELRKHPLLAHEDFKAPYDKTELAFLADRWVAWVKANESVPCVQAMAASVHVKITDFPKYLRKKVHLVALDKAVTIQNTYYVKGTGRIAMWKVQILPVNELVWVTSTKAGTPTFKYACGNRLYPASSSTSTPKSPATTPPPPAHHRTPPTCVKPPSPGSGYTWSQSKCKWIPPTPKCVKGPKPGSGYTWDQNKCKWTPPSPPVCHKGPKPGSGYTWSQSKCKWVPCSKCISDTQVQQSVQNNALAQKNGVNTGSTKGVTTDSSGKAVQPTNVAPDNNRGDSSTGTSVTKAPAPTASDSNSDSSSGSTTPSGSATTSGTTTVSSGNGTSSGSATNDNGSTNGATLSGTGPYS